MASVARAYSPAALRRKLARHARSAGREVIEKVLWLYFASRRPETPVWARATIYAALAYFILPTDLLPDLTPLVGYSDDLGALTAALLTIAQYVDANVKRQASLTLNRWFGPDQGSARSARTRKKE